MKDYHFGNYMRELREQKHLSQYQLGRLIGLSDKAVSKWENGSSKPQSGILCKLSTILGVTVDELLSGQQNLPEKEDGQKTSLQKRMCWENAHQAMKTVYGNVPPAEILSRFLSEYAELQYTDHIIFFDLFGKINVRAREMGEIFRVQSSLGASFTAFVMGATDINPLPPHYFCPCCRKLEFVPNVSDGWDLPPRRCACGMHRDGYDPNSAPHDHAGTSGTVPAKSPEPDRMQRDGHNLPFETLLPFIHRKIHFDCFISPYMYGTFKDIVRCFFGNRTVIILCKEDRPDLKTIIICGNKMPDLPDDELSYENYHDRFIGYPSITLHLSLELRFLSLMGKKTQVSPISVPFHEADVLKAFIEGDTLGIPEFGTNNIKDMMEDASPQSFHDLIQLLGLAHGTGTWIDNARLLVRQGRPLSECIAYRDDVFHQVQNTLAKKGILDTGLARRIMEDANRFLSAQTGISAGISQNLQELGFESWFAEAVQKIQYFFPKAQGVQAVKDASVLMWYKLYDPEVFSAHR